MVVIDSTPEFVANAYTIMRHNLEIVRPRLGRPMGLADKLVLSHLDDPENGWHTKATISALFLLGVVLPYSLLCSLGASSQDMAHRVSQTHWV